MIDFPVYFDNAASTFPKPENVLSAVNRNLRSNTSNPGRSGHSLSFEAAERIFEAREVISEYFGCEPENVIFTKNATESINLLLFGLLFKGDHVIVSDMEHNSVTRPLTALSSRGVTFDIADSNDIEASVKALIRPETRLIFPTAVSNVTGKVLPFRPLAQNAHKNGTWVGICGELGADLELTEAFLAIGVDELSVTPSAILPIRKKVIETNVSEIKESVLDKYLN